MTDETVELNMNKLVRNASGDEIPDMLDPPIDRKTETAPSLTLGSLIANALYTGITGSKAKDGLKYFKIAGKIEDSLKPKNEGKYVVTRADLDQLEEALGKINVPVYTLPVYAGFIQETIDDAKIELLAKEKAVTETPQ